MKNCLQFAIGYLSRSAGYNFCSRCKSSFSLICCVPAAVQNCEALIVPNVKAWERITRVGTLCTRRVHQQMSFESNFLRNKQAKSIHKEEALLEKLLCIDPKAAIHLLTISEGAEVTSCPSVSLQDVEIRTNAALYLPQISDLLNRVPRQMLLLLKTNDLLRGIETTLQTRAASSSFINMSRCCIRAMARSEAMNSVLSTSLKKCLCYLHISS